MNRKKFTTFFSTELLCLDAFILGIRIILLTSYFNQSNFCIQFLNFISLFVWLNVLVILCIKTYKPREMICIVLFLILGLLITMNSKSTIPLFTFLLFSASINCDSKKILASHFIGILLGVFITISAYYIGLIDTRIIFESGKCLNSVGFINPNTFAFFINLIIFYYLYFRNSRLTVIEFLFLFSIELVCYLLSGSRSGLFLYLFACFLFGVTKIKVGRIFIMKHSIKLILVIICFCFLAVFFCRTTPFFIEVDKLLTGRFRFAQIYLVTYGIQPFGIDISDIASRSTYGKLVLDNGYFRILINFGFIYFVVYISIFVRILIKAIKEQNLKLIMLILIMFTGLISETFWVTINSNMVILLGVQTFFDNKKKSKNSKFYFKRELR